MPPAGGRTERASQLSCLRGAEVGKLVRSGTAAESKETHNDPGCVPTTEVCRGAEAVVGFMWKRNGSRDGPHPLDGTLSRAHGVRAVLSEQTLELVTASSMEVVSA